MNSNNMKHQSSTIFRLLILSGIVLLSACSAEIEEDPTANWTAREFYEEAHYSLRIAEFETAISHLETLEARFPFSHYARQAQIDVAYAYYKYDEPDSAVSAADRFIRLHPRSPHVDYAIYLKGLANFYRGVGFLESWFPRNMAEHDPKNLKQAIQDFSALIKRFPDSIYAPDAYLRSIFLRNELAEAELIAADYYIKRDAWVAAINRAQEVVRHYQNTPARDRALVIMAKGYDRLGMTKLAADTREIIRLNPPQKQVSREDIERAAPLPPAMIDE